MISHWGEEWEYRRKAKGKKTDTPADVGGCPYKQVKSMPGGASR
jgi:hypothetical protein